VTERNAGTYTFSLVCVLGMQSAQAEVKVTVTPPPVTNGASEGGGGTVDLSWLGALLALCAARARRVELQH